MCKVVFFRDKLDWIVCVKLFYFKDKLDWIVCVKIFLKDAATDINGELFIYMNLYIYMYIH